MTQTGHIPQKLSWLVEILKTPLPLIHLGARNPIGQVLGPVRWPVERVPEDPALLEGIRLVAKSKKDSVQLKEGLAGPSLAPLEGIQVVERAQRELVPPSGASMERRVLPGPERAPPDLGLLEEKWSAGESQTSVVEQVQANFRKLNCVAELAPPDLDLLQEKWLAGESLVDLLRLI